MVALNCPILVTILCGKNNANVFEEEGEAGCIYMKLWSKIWSNEFIIIIIIITIILRIRCIMVRNI